MAIDGIELGSEMSIQASELQKLSQSNKVTAGVGENGVDAENSRIKYKYEGDLFENDNELGKMEFLQLLVTQLKYQDPLNPTDNQQFIAQMAQFSALEGTQNVEKSVTALNDNFDNFLEFQQMNTLAVSNASSTSLIGKTVRVGADTLNVNTSGEEVQFSFHSGGSKSTVAEIYNENDELVRTLSVREVMEEQANEDNDYVMTWDGRNEKGRDVDAGTYTIKFVQADGTDDAKSYAYVQDLVLGVNFTSSGATVTVKGQDLPVADIINVKQLKEEETVAGIGVE